MVFRKNNRVSLTIGQISGTSAENTRWLKSTNPVCNKMESYSASVKIRGGLKLQSFETPKVLAYAKISKLACTPFAAVGGNKEGAKKCNLSRSATSPSCDASMQKRKEKTLGRGRMNCLFRYCLI